MLSINDLLLFKWLYKAMCLSRQALRFTIIIFLSLVLLLPQFYFHQNPVIAQDNSDIPGQLISFGQEIEGVVDATTKPNDVYAVNLTAGDQILISIESVSTPYWSSNIYLLSPTSTSIEQHEILAKDFISRRPLGQISQAKASITYTPAISGTYYIWIQATMGNIAYELDIQGAEPVSSPTPAESTYVLTQPLLNAANNLDKKSGDVNWHTRTESGIWATDSMTYCARFVRMCFGEFTGVFDAANSMYEHFKQMDLIKSSNNPPASAVVFFDEHSENWNYGHAGISDGEGNCYSVVNTTSGVLLKPIIGTFQAPYLGYVSAEDFKEYHSKKIEKGNVKGYGDININDVNLAMKYVLNMIKLDANQKMAADVNGDGLIDIRDVTLIMQRSIGLTDAFPNLSKAELVDALKDLRSAMLKKIDGDIEVTAAAFTNVKDYWWTKRWADIFTAPLRVLQGTLSLLTQATDIKDLSQQAEIALSGAEAAYQVLGTMMMFHSLQEAGEKLHWGLSGPAYISSVEEMLTAADATMPPFEFNNEYYHKEIVNHLYGLSESTPLLIPRKSNTPTRKNIKFANGALEVRKSIAQVFNELIVEVENTELPSSFPLDEKVAQLKDLKTQIIKSRGYGADIRYSVFLDDKSVIVDTKLGAVGELYRVFGNIAGQLDKKLRIEQHVELINLLETAENAALLYTITYNIPGSSEIRIAQKATTLAGVITKTHTGKYFTDIEEQFYLTPQEMLLSLPAELSNLWMVADDVDKDIRYLLKHINSDTAVPEPIEGKYPPIKYRLCAPMNWEREPVDPTIEASLGKWIDENLGLKMRWVTFREGEGITHSGYLDIFDYAMINQHIWAVGDVSLGYGRIFYSPDGGKSWELQWKEPSKLFGGSHPFIVYFSTENEGWVGSKSGLYYTQDGGKYWELRDMPDDHSYISEYWFYLNGLIEAKFAYGEKYVSSDGGRSWNEVTR